MLKVSNRFAEVSLGVRLGTTEFSSCIHTLQSLQVLLGKSAPGVSLSFIDGSRRRWS
jgi:hypothetical protein